MTGRVGPPNLLRDSRVYLSGPMDFVASRAQERTLGWRHRVGQFLRELGVTVFDPWFKPEVRGLHEYGQEGESTAEGRRRWSFEPDEEGARARASCVEEYWQTMHIDLRMVDTSDFVVAYCPTNIYSVGTPHEIIVSREQHKPVLFVSPSVHFSALDELRKHLREIRDARGESLLTELEAQVPIKPNPDAIPSLWYMPLVGGDTFFDGFGFDAFRERFDWTPIPLDEHEARRPPRNPLLPFLERLNEELPRRWAPELGRRVPNDDWILWDLDRPEADGAQVKEVRSPARHGGEAS